MGDVTTELVFKLAKNLFPDCVELHLDQVVGSYWWMRCDGDRHRASDEQRYDMHIYFGDQRSRTLSDTSVAGLGRQLRILAGNDD